MKVAIFVVAILFVSLGYSSNAQLIGPGAGWTFGQEASKNAVSLAVNSALSKADASTLPPELQVIAIFETSISIYLLITMHRQEELQNLLEEAEVSLAACDDLLLTAPVWRYKICKFQTLSKIKTQLLELKIKAAAASAAATSQNPVSSDGDVQPNA